MLHEIFKVEEIDPFEYNRSFQRRKLCMQELKQCRSEEPSTYVKIIGELAEIDWNDFQRRNKSMITDLFVGQTVHGSRCIHCGQLSCLHQQTRYVETFDFSTESNLFLEFYLFRSILLKKLLSPCVIVLTNFKVRNV
jgi:hypothetical protein